MKSSLRCHALRLTPGKEIVASLVKYVEENNLKAAFILTCVGSLERAHLRLANGGTMGDNKSAMLESRHEIVSLVGTIDPGGKHLHISLSDAEGRTIGGHVLGDLVVFTTAEILLGECEDLSFMRELDTCTGFPELEVRPRGSTMSANLAGDICQRFRAGRTGFELRAVAGATTPAKGNVVAADPDLASNPETTAVSQPVEPTNVGLPPDTAAADPPSNTLPRQATFQAGVAGGNFSEEVAEADRALSSFSPPMTPSEGQGEGSGTFLDSSVDFSRHRRQGKAPPRLNSEPAPAAGKGRRDSCQAPEEAPSGAVECFVIVHNVAKRHNIGTLTRSATAFGVTKLVLVGRRDFNAFGSHGSDLHVPFCHFASLSQARDFLKGRGCEICGVEIVDSAVAVNEHPFQGSTAFLLGNEGQGLSEKELAICDRFVYIPQHGSGTASLNVTVAASIVLHHFALWAGFQEQGRAGQKFVVAERPVRRAAKNVVPLDASQLAEKRQLKAELASQDWTDGDGCLGLPDTDDL